MRALGLEPRQEEVFYFFENKFKLFLKVNKLMDRMLEDSVARSVNRGFLNFH